jgi:hypothetical protein
MRTQGLLAGRIAIGSAVGAAGTAVAGWLTAAGADVGALVVGDAGSAVAAGIAVAASAAVADGWVAAGAVAGGWLVRPVGWHPAASSSNVNAPAISQQGRCIGIGYFLSAIADCGLWLACHKARRDTAHAATTSNFAFDVLL